MRVCVIGAGFAGLAAATELVAGGIDVVRPGGARPGRRPGLVDPARPGRHRSPDHLPVPPPSRSPRSSSAAPSSCWPGTTCSGRTPRISISNLADTGMSYYVRQPVGATAGRRRVDVDARCAPVGAAVLAAAPTRAPPPATSRRTSLAGLGHRARAGRRGAGPGGDLLRAGRPPGSTRSVLRHVASLEPLPSHRVAGGNQGIARGLAARLGGPRPPVGLPRRAIDSDRSATVPGRDRRRRRVRRPRGGHRAAAAAARTAGHPGLPGGSAGAWAVALVGVAAKLHVPLPRAGPDQRGDVRAGPVLDVDRRGRSGAVQPVLHCFAGSPSALAGLDVDRGGAPGMPPWSRRSAPTWHRGPPAGGADHVGRRPVGAVRLPGRAGRHRRRPGRGDDATDRPAPASTRPASGPG